MRMRKEKLERGEEGGRENRASVFWPGAREATLREREEKDIFVPLARARSLTSECLSFHARLAHFNNTTVLNESLKAKRKASWLAEDPL